MNIFQKSKLTLMVAFACGVITQSVIAQEDANSPDGVDEDSEKITILGSRRIGRTISDSNVPIDVIGGDTLTEGGFSDMNRQLQNVIPSFNYYQPSLVDGTEHIKPASLRGLAPDQTLVLLNGRRFHSSALLNINGSAGRGSVSVDLNAIPSSSIKRIEILRDGAAAQYGSDAIAGVMNIITKDSSDGGLLSVSGGMYVTTLDGTPELTGVQTDSSGTVIANGSNRVAGIYGDDISRRDGENLTIATNLGLELGDDGFINFTGEYNVANRTNRGGYDDGDTYALNEDGTFDSREITTDRDRFFFGSPESEGLTILANAGYELASDVSLYSTLTYQSKKSESGAFYREASDEAFLIQDIYPDGFTPKIHADIDDWSFLAGGRGDFGDWTYDVSAVMGENTVAYNNTNTANVTYLSDTATSFYGGELIGGQQVLNADFSRWFDVEGLASELSFAFGLEYRNDTYEINAGDVEAYTNRQSLDDNGDPIFDIDGNPVYPTNRLFAQGSLYFSDTSEVDKSRHSTAAYVEFDMDILDDWNIVLAGRFEDYSDFGTTTNGKIATRYNLTEDVTIRGSFSTGFRAPSLQQQFYTSVSTNFIDGIAYDVGTIAATSAAAVSLGGGQLDAEQATNYSLGFTWNILENLSLTFDTYKIDIDDRVILSETLGDDDDEAAIVSEVFAENGIEGISAVRFFINGVDSSTKGADVNLAYDTDMAGGSLRLNMGLNYNSTEVSSVLSSAGPAALFDVDVLFSRRERARLENAAPARKGNFTANWDRDAYSFMFRTNYYSEVTQPGTTSAGDVTVDSAFIIDTEFGYKFTDALTGTFGVNNLLDKYPTSAVERNGEDAGQFDYIIPYANFSPYGFQGRYLYVRANYTF